MLILQARSSGLHRIGAGATPGPERPALPMDTDEALAQAAQSGNDDALQALIERHHGPLLGYLYRLTGGDRALADEWVQDAFVRMLGALHQYRSPRPFKPWLYAIALNRARDHYKRADTRHAVDQADEAWERLPADDTARGPEAQAIATALRSDVAAALRAIPLLQREALLLRYVEDMPLAAIAETLDVPVGTVKSRISLGLRRLRMLLEDR